MNKKRERTDLWSDFIRQRRNWKRLTTVLSLFVVIGTVSALMLPAITMNQPQCGIEEHKHAAECYTPSTEMILNCQEDPDGLYIHKHDSNCLDAKGDLVCQLKEKEEHIHNESCYMVPQTGTVAVHTHDDSCYHMVTNEEPTCGLEAAEGHTHGAACFATGEELICGLDESTTHQHGTECYAQPGTLMCTEAEKEGHQHSEECYGLVRGELTCTQEESVEEEAKPVLVCEKPELQLHTHSGTCYDYQEDGTKTLVCTKAEVKEHRHTDSCMTPGPAVLTCTLTEHTHTDACDGAKGLTAEEQAQVDALIVGIDGLPELEDVNAQVAAYDAAGDSTGLDAYRMQLVSLVSPVLDQYDGMTADQQGAVTNAAKLIALKDLLSDSAYFDFTEEERRQIDDVVLSIDALPMAQVVTSELIKLQQQGDLQELAMYKEKMVGAVTFAKESYDALTDAQKEAVTNRAVLTEFEFLFREDMKETLLEAAGTDFRMLALYSEKTGLPEGTQLQVQPVSDQSEAYEDYLAQINELLDGPQALAVWIYDIGFTNQGAPVTPNDEVKVQIDFDTPLEVEGAVTYVAVHFGEDGPEILPVKRLVEDGKLTGFVHSQSSFSPTAYVAVGATDNPADVGPDWFPVEYYVFIDGKWTLVGSTKTGWQGDYTIDPATGGYVACTNTNRDRISVEQMMSILGPYGFSGDTSVNLALQRAYKRREDAATSAYRDCQLYYDTANSHYMIPMSRNKLPTSGFNLYYMPTNTDTGGIKMTDLQTYVPAGSEFYSVRVLDAQNLAYTAEETLPATQVIQTGKDVTVTVKNSEYGWQWVTSDGIVTEAVGTANEDNTTTYTTTVKKQLTLTPRNSNLEGCAASGKPVHFVVWLDGKWTEVGTVGTSYMKEGLCQGSNDSAGNPRWRWFITTEQAYSVLAPFGYEMPVFEEGVTSITPANMGKDESGKTIQTCMDFMHQSGAMDTSGRDIYSSGSWSLMADGKTWAIGMSYSDLEYTMYYVPGSDLYYQGDGKLNHTADKFAATASNLDGSRFWSVSVQDEEQLVYDLVRQKEMTVYVPEGGNVTVQVDNGDGVLWSSVGQKVEPFQEGNRSTFAFENVKEKIQVVASHANPEFTVQYYANIERYVLGSSGNLDVINTKGKKLPPNGTSQSLLWLTLEQTGVKTDQNRGTKTILNRVKTKKELTKLYTEGKYRYEESPGLRYFDKQYEQPNYKLSAVCVLKDGKNPDSVNENEWWWYLVNDEGTNVTFTNVSSEENAPRVEGVKQPSTGDYCILLRNATVIRLQYEAAGNSYSNRATFYDYDISSGLGSDARYIMGDEGNILTSGINHPSNYSASRDGKSNWSKDGLGTTYHNYNGRDYKYWCENVYAFGNANCFTGLGKAKWNTYYLNKFNGNNEVSPVVPYTYKGCAFGLVTGLDSNGNLIWNSKISAPRLFNEGSAKGKYTYSGGTLTFRQVGDMYTLSGANSTVGSRNNLEYFFNPSPDTSKTHSHIFTNNFWLVDDAKNRNDGNWGAWGKNAKSYGYSDTQVHGWTNADNYILNSAIKNLPLSDDGVAHNWFFGMNFSLSFALSADYVGPLEYIFFGDDDMWVFLDDQLICDIGGVHSAVGEYVDLRDWLPNGSSGQHTLTFYYTERGASGSTCWMSFTLPSVTSATTGRDIGGLQITKDIANENGGLANDQYLNEEYSFKLELRSGSENGSPLPGTYSYKREDVKGNTTYGTAKHDTTLRLKAGDKLWISGLPAGAWYSITEAESSRDGYYVTVNGGSGYIVKGTISSGNISDAKFVNNIRAELPETGWSGPFPYIFSGWAIIFTACALMYIKKRKQRNGAR